MVQPSFFLDGHNNPGFSGGPVLFKVQEHGELKVASSCVRLSLCQRAGLPG